MARGAQDLSYTVAGNAKWRETVTLLSGISGSLHAGQMLALVRRLEWCSQHAAWLRSACQCVHLVLVVLHLS